MRPKYEMGIRAEKLGAGQTRVFRTAKEAAEGLGVSTQAIFHALGRKNLCKGHSLDRVTRLWVVKTDDGEYSLCFKNCRGTFETVKYGNCIFDHEISDSREVTQNMWGDYGR